MGKYAIFIVLALTFSLITYSHALKNALFMSNARTVQSYSYSQAQNIAQSAAMLAITSLRNDANSTFLPNIDDIYSYPSLNGFQEWEEMHGSYNLSLTNQGDTLLVLRSTGKFEETNYLVTLGLVIGPSIWNPYLDQALHAENIIDLSSGSSDMIIGEVSINSTASNAVRLGSNNRIKITEDLFIGPGGDKQNVLTGNHNNVGGEVRTLDRKLNYDLPIFPQFPTGSPPFTFSNHTELHPEQYNGYYINEINLQGSNNLTIHTGDENRVLHVGRLDVQSSNINVIGDGKLTIYVENFLDMKGNAKINENGDVNQLHLFYRGDPEVDLYDESLDFGGNTQFNGSLYSEKASINMNGTAGIRGNIITGGNKVTIRGNPSLELDHSRVIFAPNGIVEAKGNVTIKGSVIAKEFYGSGNSTLEYSKLDVDLPDLEQEGGGYDIAYWN